MAIKEIKFMNNEVFLLKDVDISLAEFIDQMKNVQYDSYYDAFRSEKDDDVENIKFPPIIYSFYSFIFYNKKLPLPEELINNYFQIYSDQITVSDDCVIYNSRKYKRKALIARILRTYPSVVRDFHFYLMLVNEGSFDKVIYSCRTDTKGKDILIKHHGTEYQLSLYVDTKRSNLFKKIKNRFRHRYENEIKLPLELKSENKIGDFFVYTHKHIDYIKKEIL